jgi:hypothetical protein
MQQKMRYKQHTFPSEELVRVLAGEGDSLREVSHKLDDLSDMVVIFGVPTPASRIEEVVPTRK